MRKQWKYSTLIYWFLDNFLSILKKKPLMTEASYNQDQRCLLYHLLDILREHQQLWSWSYVNILAFLGSKWQKNLVPLTVAEWCKGLYIALVSQNRRLVKIKTSFLFTLLTFAQVSVQWVVAFTCCTVSRNIAVAAVFNVTPCCKKKSENFQSFLYTANYLLSHWNNPVVYKHELAFRFLLAQNNQSSTAYEKSISLMFTISCTKNQNIF